MPLTSLPVWLSLRGSPTADSTPILEGTHTWGLPGPTTVLLRAGARQAPESLWPRLTPLISLGPAWEGPVAEDRGHRRQAGPRPL